MNHLFTFKVEITRVKMPKIRIGSTVRIGGEYYHVIDDPVPPRPFMSREGEKRVGGWRFFAEDIINETLINFLKEGKIPFLTLNPTCVEES